MNTFLNNIVWGGSHFGPAPNHLFAFSFGENIRTWAEGVAYGRVATEHKGEAELDPDPVQWHGTGSPTPFEEVLPRRWQQPGFVRKTRLTHPHVHE